MTHSINDKARKKKRTNCVQKSKYQKLNAKFVLINQSSITVEIVCDHKSFVSFYQKKTQSIFTYVAD